MQWLGAWYYYYYYYYYIIIISLLGGSVVESRSDWQTFHWSAPDQQLMGNHLYE